MKEKTMKLIATTTQAIGKMEQDFKQATNEIEANIWRESIRIAVAYRAGLRTAMEMME